MPAPASVPSDSAAAYGLSRSLVFVSRRHSAAFSPSEVPTAPRPLTTSPKTKTIAAPVCLAQMLPQSFSGNVLAMRANAVEDAGTRRLFASQRHLAQKVRSTPQVRNVRPAPASVPSGSAAAYGLSRSRVFVAVLHSGCLFALRSTNRTAPAYHLS